MEDEIRLADRQLLLSEVGMRLAMRPRLADIPAVWNRAFEAVPKLHLEGFGAPFELSDPGKIVLPPATAVFAYLIVPLRNIGTGPAVITGARLAVEEIIFDDYASSEVVVPVGEITSFVFSVPRDRLSSASIAEALIRREQVEVTVSYTNAQGGDSQHTHLSLGKDPSSTQKMKILSIRFPEEPSTQVDT
jgi:hypothetical protein